MGECPSRLELCGPTLPSAPSTFAVPSWAPRIGHGAGGVEQVTGDSGYYDGKPWKKDTYMYTVKKDRDILGFGRIRDETEMCLGYIGLYSVCVYLCMCVFNSSGRYWKGGGAEKPTEKEIGETDKIN